MKCYQFLRETGCQEIMIDEEDAWDDGKRKKLACG